ncbi:MULTISPECIES: PAS domain S-box protein [unclassified Yoonia]|uniref:sensor histidine kinase n=1 Tax=unclassified Yoonia TaxID=2629118 RepID=UPI002AFE7482|nr:MULTISPECIES: PAS domain S-box protein [unclassified Yoonia]
MATDAQQAGDQFARLRRLVNLSPAAIVEVDASGAISFTNPRWQDLRGTDGDWGTAQLLADIVAPASAESYDAAMAALAAGTPHIATELAFCRADNTAFHVSGSLAALYDAEGNYAGTTGIFIDITERVIAERKLRASEARLRQILDNTVALIGVMQPDGTLIEANKPALAVAGLSRADVVGKKFWDCFWWSYDPAIMAELQSAIALAATGQQQRYDTAVRIEDGTLMPLDFMLSPVFDDDGNVELLVPSGLDISDRKRSEGQLAFVMREVNHRSKNMLAVVQSILRQMRPNDVDQFVRDFGARLRALANGQDLLVNSSDDSPELAALVQTQLTYFAQLSGIRLRVSGPAMRISSEVAQSLGMAIYELATNAGKYGALSNTTGQIDISWQIENGMFSLTWQESGGPDVVPPISKGFGTVVLEDMLTMALGATTQISYLPSGVVWTLQCPVEAMLAHEPQKE